MPTTVAITTITAVLGSLEAPHFPPEARAFAAAIAANITHRAGLGLYKDALTAEQFLTVTRVTLNDLQQGSMLDGAAFPSPALVGLSDDLSDRLDTDCTVPFASLFYPQDEISTYEERISRVLARTNPNQMCEASVDDRASAD